jgi:hypothetical protein
VLYYECHKEPNKREKGREKKRRKGEKKKGKRGQKRGKIQKFSCWQLWMLSCHWATAQLLQRLLSTQAAEAAVPLQLKNSGYATDLGINVEKLPNSDIKLTQTAPFDQPSHHQAQAAT